MNWKPMMPAIVWLKSPDAKKIGKRQAFFCSGNKGEYRVEPVFYNGKIAYTSTVRAPGTTTVDDVGKRHYASSISAMRAAQTYDSRRQ